MIMSPDSLQVAAKSTTQETLQVAKQLYAAFGSGNIQAVLDLLVDDITWELTGSPEITPWFGKHQGHEQVSKFFDLIKETIDILSFDVKEIVAQDDKAMVLIKEKGYCKPTKRKYEAAIVHIISVNEGKIVNFFSVLESGPLLAALLDRDI